MKGEKHITQVIILVYLLLLVVALEMPGVLADGDYDDLPTTVTVGNEPPTVGAITCNASDYTPIAESSFFFNCTATVSDNNGYQDLMAIRGEFYNDSQSASANYTKHYNNATCAFTTNGTSSTNSTVECRFEIYYHANPADWTVYFNVTDEAGATGNNTNTVTINSITALNVTHTAINFGSIDLGATSGQQTTTIKNTGNVELDIRINESLHAGNMTCDGTGSDNINTSATSTGVRYNTTSGFNFDETAWKLTSGNDLIDVNWSKSYDGGSSTPPEYNLYWLIKIPSSGISGTCTTTTRISATAS